MAGGRIGWQAPTGGARTYKVVAEDNGAQAVWAFDSTGPQVTLDPRVLEDTAGSVAVSVRSGATAEETTVDISTARSGCPTGAPPARRRRAASPVPVRVPPPPAGAR